MSDKIIVKPSIGQQLELEGLYWETLEPPEPDHRAPRYLCRYDSGAWFALEPDRGVTGITRKEACRRAILDAENADADFIEVSVKPLDESVFFTAGLPPRKGLTRRDVFLVTPRTDPRDPHRQPVRIPFRSVKRTLWAWCTSHTSLADIHEIGERGGIGDCLFRVPRALEIEVPSELVGVAADRVAHWEAIARRMAEEALENTLAADVDVTKLSKAAAKEYSATWRDAPLPAICERWTADAQAVWREVHERLCRNGAERYAAAPAHAIRIVAEQVAADIVSGARTI